jgi:hypothetical protein
MLFRVSARAVVLGAAALTCGCSHSPSDQPAPKAPAPAGTTEVMMSFARSNGFYDAPFPSDDLRASDGTINLNAFPNPYNVSLMVQAKALASQLGTFATSGGVFLQTTAAVDPTSLPDVNTSITAKASVFLLAVDPAAPDYLKRIPVEATFEADAGPFGALNLVELVPIQGTPMRANERYAAVVTTAVKDMKGAALTASPEMTALAKGEPPSTMSAPAKQTYAAALAALAKAGVASDSVVGLAAFTTGDPTAQFGVFLKDILSRPLPVPDTQFAPTDQYDDYCVFQSTIPMPDYQSGTPPFTNDGGAWLVDPTTGKPVFQRFEEARIEVTIPRTTMPDAGYPIVLFIRTGAGGDRPLVDRGPQGVTNGPPLVPGTGPALYFAHAGFAGISPDGPLGGLRNTTNANEDFTIFNVFNAVALRDNVRESALELAMFAHVIPTISFDAITCAGAKTSSGSTIVKFDASHLALMGHSMGSTISPLAMAFEPSFGSLILSGAGGSWIENVVYKQLPLDVPGLLDSVFQYNSDGRTLTEHDPAATMFQWAIESADPQVYDHLIIDEPLPGSHARNVLMVQGIVDHYILPPIANTTTLTVGLDLVSQPLDQINPALSTYTPVLDLLPLVGHGQIALPATGNVTGGDGTKVTAVLMQQLGDGIEDGHEVVFQTDPPKHEYQCFLASSLKGTPTAQVIGDTDAGCP